MVRVGSGKSQGNDVVTFLLDKREKKGLQPGHKLKEQEERPVI